MRPPALAVAAALVACSSPIAPAPTTAPPTTAASPATTGPASTPGAAMSWSRIADIPTPRSEVAAAVFAGAIYVIGGFGGPNRVERYVPRTARWETQPDLPIGVDHPMAAGIDNGPGAGVYAFGGNSGGRPTARVFHLAPAASAWREVAPMPVARSAGAAVAVLVQALPARIYVVGGASDRGLEPSTVEYDTATGAWRTRAQIPTPRDHLAGALLEQKACAVGGRTLSMTRNLPALECYDPGTDSWARLPAAPTARGGVGAAVIGRTLFFIGGEQTQGTFREVEIYDAATRQWSRGPDLPTPRHGIGVAAIGDAVYVLAGGPTPGGSQTPVCEVLSVR